VVDLPSYLGPRLKLVLGKYPIVRVEAPILGIKQFAIRVNEITIVINATHDADVREGDLISLYTEVPLAISKQSVET
jgi:hypothetical protein